MRSCSLLPLLLVFVTAGCDFAPRSGSHPVTPPASVKKRIQNPMGEPSTLVDFSVKEIKSEHIRTAILHWEQVIARLEKDRPQDVHVSWSTHPVQGAAVMQWWTNAPERISFGGIIRNHVFSAGSDVRLLRISCAADRPKATSSNRASVTVEQFWGDEWIILFNHITKDLPATDFTSLTFHRRATPTRQHIDLNVFPELGIWRTGMKFAEVDYQFLVALPDSSPKPSELRTQRLAAQMRSMRVSPQSFRDHCHKILDELEQLVKTKLPSTEAIEHAYITVRVGGTHGGDPPRDQHQASDRPLQADEWHSVIAAALTDISLRRKFIDEHHVEFHGALAKMLPVHELLEISADSVPQAEATPPPAK